MSLEDQIATLIASVGAKLYDAETASEGKRKIYRVYIDREGGADVALCAKVSRLISPLLDVTPPIEGEYSLEVSSPGIERRLRTIEHFRGAIGETIKLTLRDKTKIKGRLQEVGDGFARLEALEPIALDSIAKARVVYAPR
ncbi:MAG: ribosome maturation factor RimP [Helicobacteraceae bacterium]|jgi:ribosome maturation factor RimP|nr:ribosome maturation factor RimP [Helicobacteraceae bacterium]